MKKLLILLLLSAVNSYGALSAKYGSFAKPATTTGNQSVSDVGFQPKVVIFFGNDLTGDGTAVNAKQFFGAATGPNKQFVISDDSRDAAASSQIDKRYSGSKCIAYLTGGTPTLLAEAGFVSLDSGGFTVNWTTNDSVQRIVNYLALGGTDLNVHVGTFTAPTSATTKAITGVGFQPDGLIIADNSVTTTPTAEGNAASGAFNIGFVIGTSTQVNRVTMRQDAQASASNTWGYQRTSSCQNSLSGAGAVVRTATISSMDSDGFTLSFNPAPANAVYIGFIAFDGASINGGYFDQAAVTGNQSVSGLGFQPKAVIFQSAGYAASAAVSSVSRITFGVGISSSERGTIWSGDLDAQANEVADQALSRAKVMVFYTEGTPTLNSDVDMVSMDSGGFTINNTSTDGTARQILFLALGDAPSAPPAGGGFIKRKIIINNN